MKTVEYWRWWTYDIGGTKLAKSRHYMDEATALERHPEATRVQGTLILREVYEAGERMPDYYKPGITPTDRG